MMAEREHFKLTSNYTDPKHRFFHGHFITALQLKNEVIETE